MSKEDRGAKAVTWDWNIIQSVYSDESRCYQLTDRHIAVLLPVLQQMAWSTRWFNRPTDFGDILDFVASLSMALMNPVPCNDNISNYSEHMPFTGGTFDNLLELLMELDMKFQLPDGSLYEPAIPLVPCGCGDSTSTSATTPPLSIPGASGSADYNNIATLCDAVASLPAQIIDQMDDYLGKIQSGAITLDTITVELAPLLDSILPAISDIEMELQDPDFLIELQDAIVLSFNDPWTPINRADLQKFTKNIPVVFEGAPMMPAFYLWSFTANLNLLNGAVRNGAGTGNQADCEGIFSRNGRTPYTPQSNTGSSSVIDYTTPLYRYQVHLAQLGVPATGTPGTFTNIYVPDTIVCGGGMKATATPQYEGAQWGSIRMWVQANDLDRQLISSGTVPAEGTTSISQMSYDDAYMTPTDADAMRDLALSYFGASAFDIYNSTNWETRNTAGDTGQISVGAFSSAPVDYTNTVDWAFVITREDLT